MVPVRVRGMVPYCYYIGLVPYHHLALVLGDSPVFSSHFSLKIFYHHLAHPDPQAVHQVELVMRLLISSPLVHPVLEDVSPGSILEPELSPPDPQGVEVGHMHKPILCVK